MKPIFTLLFTFLLIHASAQQQTEQSIVAQGLKYETELNDNAALGSYREVLRLYPNSYIGNWKASEMCSRVGARQATKEKKRAFYAAARKYAEAAIKINPNGADGYFVLAVAMGRLALMNSGEEKIKAVKAIKTNADKAIKLNPNHGYAWHVLGKWYYEVSKLSYLEKAAVKVMFGALPSATLEDAIKAFERSKQLAPDFALNYLELARCYEDDDQKEKAIQHLKKLPSLPNKTQDDARVKEKGAALLKELTS